MDRGLLDDAKARVKQCIEQDLGQRCYPRPLVGKNPPALRISERLLRPHWGEDWTIHRKVFSGWMESTPETEDDCDALYEFFTKAIPFAVESKADPVKRAQAIATLNTLEAYLSLRGYDFQNEAKNDVSLPHGLMGRELLSCGDLAKKFGVPKDALRKRLERFRAESGRGYETVENRGRRQAQYLYYFDAVEGIISELKNVRQMSAEK
jgi:hypothetical protein